jgi:hypothetical protein
LFILWRRTEGWLTLWIAALLVLLGTSSVSPEMPALSTLWPGVASLYTSAGMLGMVSFVHILFLAPDGRFAPRLTWWVAAGFTGGVLALGLYAQTGLRQWEPLASLGGLLIGMPVWLVLIGLGLFSQAYRYRHVSSALQRQQTKWMVVGLAAVTLGILVNVSLLITAGSVTGLARVWINLARAPLVYLPLLALPISLAFSILRYRLWDIDVLIRRTLIYSILTGLLALAYLVSVVVMQNLLRTVTGQSQNQLVTVVSTLVIVALSVPLPGRVQAFIDRRFYRRKYDAARTLASFAAGARNEVELERLSGRLVGIVQDTMQPVHVSLWLKPSPAGVHPSQ